mgnify:CR=1 FL=1
MKILILPLILCASFANAQSPGGIGPNLQLWTEANQGAYTNAGTTLATDGQIIRQLNDQ